MIQQIVQTLGRNIGILDLRPTEQFNDRHLSGCTSIPATRLEISMHELPANHQPLSLMGNKEQIENAVPFLYSKNYHILNQFEVTDAIWQAAEKMNLIESGNQSRQLWQANPLFVDAIETIEKSVRGRNVIDLACGAGRDSVYMAMRGWTVNSVDYKQDALDRAVNLATINSTAITPWFIDLEATPNPFEHSEFSNLESYQADLVMVMRYLHRPLFPAINCLIKPGGAIFYSTFMEGSEQYGSPKNPAYLLKEGELAEIFSSYEILIDEKRHLADGRPVACFLARKRF